MEKDYSYKGEAHDDRIERDFDFSQWLIMGTEEIQFHPFGNSENIAVSEGVIDLLLEDIDLFGDDPDTNVEFSQLELE